MKIEKTFLKDLIKSVYAAACNGRYLLLSCGDIHSSRLISPEGEIIPLIQSITVKIDVEHAYTQVETRILKGNKYASYRGVPLIISINKEDIVSIDEEDIDVVR